MQMGMIGLGGMGANMVRRLMNAGHECVVFDRAPSAVEDLARHGAVGASSLQELVRKLEKPRAVWMAIQAAIDEGVPSPVLTTALYQRFTSRGESEFADRVLSAMRHAFGGHEEKDR